MPPPFPSLCLCPSYPCPLGLAGERGGGLCLQTFPLAPLHALPLGCYLLHGHLPFPRLLPPSCSPGLAVTFTPPHLTGTGTLFIVDYPGPCITPLVVPALPPPHVVFITTCQLPTLWVLLPSPRLLPYPHPPIVCPSPFHPYLPPAPPPPSPTPGPRDCYSLCGSHPTPTWCTWAGVCIPTCAGQLFPTLCPIPSQTCPPQDFPTLSHAKHTLCPLPHPSYYLRQNKKTKQADRTGTGHFAVATRAVPAPDRQTDGTDTWWTT